MSWFENKLITSCRMSFDGADTKSVCNTICKCNSHNQRDLFIIDTDEYKSDEREK